MRRIKNKKLPKKDRAFAILFGLISLYIKTQRPIGSNTLRENGFEYFSSATIRNYFNKLEKLGYLQQPHSSGGRIPTTLAYREYANSCLEELRIKEADEKELKKLKIKSNRLTAYLHNAANLLSQLTSSPVFLKLPYFDQDFIRDIKLIKIDQDQLLSVIITDFGQIKTELLSSDNMKDEDIKQIEGYLLSRFKGEDEKKLENNLKTQAQKIYKEILLRYLALYSAKDEKIFKTGFSKLLLYPEFQDPKTLANSLSIFEDPNGIKPLITECMKINRLTSWIGDELSSFDMASNDIAIVAIPYLVNRAPVGAVAILVPKRSDYSRLFGILEIFSQYLSESLTKSVYKFKIGFQKEGARSIMLEHKRKI